MGNDVKKVILSLLVIAISWALSGGLAIADPPPPPDDIEQLRQAFIEKVFVPECGEGARSYLKPHEKGFWLKTPNQDLLIALDRSVIDNPQEARNRLRKVIIAERFHPFFRSQGRDLFRYQQETLLSLMLDLEAGHDRGLVVLPTAAGKTVIAVHFAYEFHDKFTQENKGQKPRILFIADNLSLLRQAQSEFLRIWPQVSGVALHENETGLYIGSEKSPDARIVFASIQTLLNESHRKNLDLSSFSLILIDEFHHAGAERYGEVIQEFLGTKRPRPTYVAGFTATPFRSVDDVDVPAILGGRVVYQGYPVSRAVEEGWVAPVRLSVLTDDIDYEELMQLLEADEKTLSEEEKVWVDEWLKKVIGIYRNKVARGESFKKGLIFVRSQAVANRVERAFEIAKIPGLTVKAIISDLGEGEVQDRVERFKDGRIDAAIVVNMFREGMDVPDIEVEMRLKQTTSLVAYAHEIGRAMRLAPRKTEAEVIDFFIDYESLNAFLDFCKGEWESGPHKNSRSNRSIEEIRQRLSVILGREVHFSEHSFRIFDHEYQEIISGRREAILREWGEKWSTAEGKEKKGWESFTGSAAKLEVGATTLHRWFEKNELRSLLPPELIEKLNELIARRHMDSRAKIEEWRMGWEEAPAEEKRVWESFRGAAEKLGVSYITLLKWFRKDELRSILPLELVEELNELIARRHMDSRAKMEEWKRGWEKAIGEEKKEWESFPRAAKNLAVSHSVLIRWFKKDELRSILPLELVEELNELIARQHMDSRAKIEEWRRGWEAALPEERRGWESFDRAAAKLEVGATTLHRWFEKNELRSLLPPELIEKLDALIAREAQRRSIDPRAKMEEWRRGWEEAIGEEKKEWESFKSAAKKLGVSYVTLGGWFRKDELRNILPPEVVEKLNESIAMEVHKKSIDPKAKMEEWKRGWEEASAEEKKGWESFTGSAEKLGVSGTTPHNWFRKDELRNILPAELIEKLEALLAKRNRAKRPRPDRGEVLLPFSREAVIENGKGVSRILFAEQIKELWFALTEWDSQRMVAYYKNLIENPVEVLLSLEGFVLTDKAAQAALGFQNGQALDIRFLEKWPAVHKLAMAVKRQLPMAIAMGIMESLKKISERKDLLESLEKADLIEKEFFYVEVNNAILQSIILYANASCDVMTDIDTYKGISKRVGQFVVAGNVVYYGKKIAQLGRLYCQGAKVRAAVEAGSMSPPGYVALTLDLAATLIVEKYLNDMVDGFIRWWEEWGYTAKIEEAQEVLLHLKRDANWEDQDFISAIQNLEERVEEYRDYLMKDVKLALLKGEMSAKGMEDFYQERIENIRNRRPHRRHGEYKVSAMGSSGTQYGEIEESYEKTMSGWRIKRVPLFDGKTSESANGYWGSVNTPAQFQQMTEEEFGKYSEAVIRETEKYKNESGQSIRGHAFQNALGMANRVYEVISPVIREQLEFLKSLFPSLYEEPENKLLEMRKK